MIAAVIE